MPTYYCGPGGSDLNNGLTWGTRKLTLNGVEDIPVVAGDTVYAGPGVYRELLTCDVSGGAGTEITYIADITGEHTDGVGGTVRITGSDTDQVAVRANCIVMDNKDYRVFRGFSFDTATGELISASNGCTHITLEDCTFQNDDRSIRAMGGPQDWVLRRCLFFGYLAFQGTVTFENTVTIDNTNNLVENCDFINGGEGICINIVRVGGVTIRNSLLWAGDRLISIGAALAVGQTTTVNNCVLIFAKFAVIASVVGEIIENFNTFYGNTTDRTNTNVGANSVTYPPLFQPPLLHSGASQASGFAFPVWFFGELSEWSQIRALGGSLPPSVDLFGIARPTNPADRSWGPIQFMDAERDTAVVHGGSASLAFREAGRKQIFVPTTNVQTTIATWVYRGAGYVGTNPQMVIKQPGAADRTTTDAGGAGGWNQLTDTFTPAASPPYVVVELVSNYGTSTTTTSSSTSTTSTSTTSTSTTTLTSTSTSSLSTSTTSLSTSTTSTSSTTLPYDVYFDDLTVT